MNVSMNTAIQAPMQHRPPPPNSEQVAMRMADSVAKGDMNVKQLQENLSKVLNVEDTSSIVAEDGGVDVNALTDILEANKPSGEGGLPPPPPGGGRIGTGGPSGSDTTLLVTNILGEDGLKEVTENDGSFDLNALVDALRERIAANNQSESGNLLDVMA